MPRIIALLFLVLTAYGADSPVGLGAVPPAVTLSDAGFTYPANSGSLTLATGTITSSDPGLTINQTWNNGATAFTSLAMAITNTASSTISNLMNISVGGSSKFTIRPTGRVLIGGASDDSVNMVQANGGIRATGTMSCNDMQSSGGLAVSKNIINVVGPTALSDQQGMVVLDGTSNAVTITLPTAAQYGAAYSQALFLFCKNATSTVTVNRASSDTISGPGGVGITTFTMTTGTGFIMYSDGVSAWYYH